MKKALLIAEKPSLMRTIQDVYKKHKDKIDYDITFVAQAGHLIGLKMPNEIDEKYKKWDMSHYPMDISYQYKVLKGKNDLYKSIASEIKSGKYDVIIHAGDPDQEGELLVRLVLNRAKNTLPVLRFWSNDLTEQAVLSALTHMKDDSEYDHLYEAALIRQHKDYDFGMNLTGAMSLKQNKTTRIGRVKAVIVRLLADREAEIKAFVPHSDYKHSFYHKKYHFLGETVFQDKDECQSTLATKATITEIKDNRSKIKPPKLYKLSTAQTDAYKLFGFNGKKTLDLIASLYEKGYMSYPRTDCEYISEATDAISIVDALGDMVSIPDNSLRNPSIVMQDKSYFNNKAIATEGHTALIPTGIRPKALTSDEEKIFLMILRRFIAIFGQPKEVHTIEATAVDDMGEQYHVKAVEDISGGFEFILNPNYTMRTLPSNETLEKGNALPIQWEVSEIKAKCPARYTDGSLIAALERPSVKVEGVVYKIGTPATRANIIEDVGKAGYYTKSGGKFTATDFAMKTVANFKQLPLFNIETTGIWEQNLEAVRNGVLSADEVDKQMNEELVREIEEIKNCVIDFPFQSEYAKKNSTAPKIMDLKCPKCGQPLQETDKAFGCSGWKTGCKFAIWKTNKLLQKDPITKDDVEKIVNGDIITKTCTSSKGTTWQQKLLFDMNNNQFTFIK